MSLNNRRGILTVTLALMGAATGGVARADSWMPAGETCTATLPGGTPHFFAYTSPGSGARLALAWGTGSTWNRTNLVTATDLQTAQIACGAAGNNQILVVYRSGLDSTIHSRDRLSGWAESTPPNAINSSGTGLFVTPFTEGGRWKFALFTDRGRSSSVIMMSIWDDAASPKWSQPVFLDAVPGNLSPGSGNHLTGYAINVGPSASQAVISVFAVSQDGHLRENRGGSSGTRTWIDHGLAPGNRPFSTAPGWGPTAQGFYNSPFGHPGDYFESEYARRIVVPTADQTAIFSREAVSSATFTWNQVAGPTTSPPFGLDAASGTASGCPASPGAPCAAAMQTVVRFLSSGVSKFAYFHSGVTGISPPPPGNWVVLPPAISTQPSPSYGGLAGTAHGALFYISAANNLVVMNLDTFAVNNIPPP